MRLSELWKHSRIDAEFAAHPDIAWQHSLEAKALFLPLEKAVDFIGSGHTPYLHDVSEGDIGFVTVECVGPLTFNADKLKRIHKEHYDNEFGNKRVSAGSVLCTIKRRICQAYPFIEKPDQPLAINQDVAILKPKSTMRPAYLAAYLSCRIGQSFADRQRTEQMNPYISVSNLSSLPVAEASDAVQGAVQTMFLSAQRAFKASIKALHEANDSLIQAVGLTNWHPPDPLTYTRRASEVFAASRVDSPYFSPRVSELLQLLARDNLRIGDVAPPRHAEFVQGSSGEFDYIEISDIQTDGTAASNRLSQSEAPSRATWYVRPGDVLASTVRPIRRLSAIVAPEQDSFVCSSGLVVLAPQAVSSELLLTYLRLPQVCELMDLHTSASMYPAISEGDLLNLPFRRVSSDVECKIVAAVKKSHSARREAHILLDRAKRAVEIAIEQSEAEALRYLSESSV